MSSSTVTIRTATKIALSQTTQNPGSLFRRAVWLPGHFVETYVATSAWKRRSACTWIRLHLAGANTAPIVMLSTGMPVTPGLLQISDAVTKGVQAHPTTFQVGALTSCQLAFMPPPHAVLICAANPLQQNLVMLPNRGYRRGYYRAGYLDCACTPWRLDRV